MVVDKYTRVKAFFGDIAEGAEWYDHASEFGDKFVKIGNCAVCTGDYEDIEGDVTTITKTVRYGDSSKVDMYYVGSVADNKAKFPDRVISAREDWY